MTFIKYVDVCKSNDTMLEFLKAFPELKHVPLDNLCYGYLYVTYKDEELDITIKRNATYAGNQYIEVRPKYGIVEGFKIPMNVDISLVMETKRIEKLYNKIKEKNKELAEGTARRNRINHIMAGSNYPKWLEYNSSSEYVYNNFKKYYQIDVDVTEDIDFQAIESQLMAHKIMYQAIELERNRLQEKINKELGK